MEKYKKGSIEYIIKNDLIELKYTRDELLEELKKCNSNSKELNFLVQTICNHNVAIDSLESVLTRYKNSKKESKQN